jgi:hypothetical protein
LLALLAKLYMPTSHRTLTATMTVKGADRTPVHVALVSESDEAHYAEREYPPGPLQIDAAAALQVATDLIEQTADALMDEYRAAALNKLATQVGYQRVKLEGTVRIV